MTGPDTQTTHAALEPLRSALLGRARRDAGDVVAEARRWAADVLSEARDAADGTLAAAASSGRADAAEVIAVEGTRARRAARAIELSAQREVYDELRRRVTEQVRARASGAGTCEHLLARARALLGPAATVMTPPGGGVVAQVPGKRVDLSADVLAEHAVEQLGAEVRALWVP